MSDRYVDKHAGSRMCTEYLRKTAPFRPLHHGKASWSQERRRQGICIDTLQTVVLLESIPGAKYYPQDSWYTECILVMAVAAPYYAVYTEV